MAKNIDVIKNFVNGTNNKVKTTNLRIEDDKLFNYNTVLAERLNGSGFVVNKTKYSQSTSTIQNKLIAEIPSHMILETFEDMDMGAQRFDYDTMKKHRNNHIAQLESNTCEF